MNDPNPNLAQNELLLQIEQLKSKIVELEASNASLTAAQTRTEETFHKNEEKYHTLFNSIDEGVTIIEMVYDERGHAVDYRFLEVNPAFERQTGLKNVAGKLGSEVIPNRESYWLEVFSTVITTGEQIRFENYNEGAGRWYSVYATQVDSQGSHQLAIVFEDITRRKDAEEALRESEERFLGLRDSGIMGIAFFEPGGGLTEANDTFLQMIGYSRDDIRAGRIRWDKLTPPEWMPRTKEALEEFRAKGIISPYEKEYFRSDGSRFWGLFGGTRLNGSQSGISFVIDITDRKRTEEALRKSEDKYHTLFYSIDEGFCLIELIFAAEKAGGEGPAGAVDYRFLEVNQVYERQAGQQNPSGKLGSEVTPNVEPYWLENYSKVVQTGEPIRFENYHEDTGRWYFTYASRVGGQGSRQVAIVFRDITERKLNELRQEFLLKLSDTLLHLSDPLQIQREAVRVLSEHLGASRVGYAEDQGDGENVCITYSYTKSGPGIEGCFRYNDYDPELLRAFRAGQTVIRSDIAGDPALSEEEKCAHAALGLGATVNIPLVKEGRLVTILFVHQEQPRKWRDYEILLMQETAERTWETVERARAEKALRLSEQNLQGVANIVPDLLWFSEPDGDTTWYNERWYEYTGQTYEETLGWGWLEAIHPDDREAAARRFREAIEAQQPLEQEHRIKNTQGEYRWFLVRIQPIFDQEGRVSRMYGAATDIHDKRLTLEELEKRVADRTAELAATNFQLAELNSQLQKDRERLRLLSARLMEVQETERRYLARELHDEIGQLLTGLKLQLETNKILNGKTTQDRNGDIGQKEVEKQSVDTIFIVDEMTRRIRDLSLNLRPTLLDDAGLVPALQNLFARFTNQTTIKVNFYQKGLERRFDQPIETTVYRLVQEALTNIARYASVDKASVQIVVGEDTIILFIQDEGAGFELEETLSGYNSTGLSAMRERVELVGGTITIESAPGKGTSIAAEIPI